MDKVIKTEHEYEVALEEIDKIMDLDPTPGTEAADRLELLTILVQDYENKQEQLSLPDPVDAIQFRMEQQGLTQRDLVPYLGSRSRVSEILSRQRPLTLTMIRALHSGLGIPANVLIQASKQVDAATELRWESFPLAEMVNRGWIDASLSTVHKSPKDELMRFLRPVGDYQLLAEAVLYRTSSHVRSKRKMDSYALLAWTAQIIRKALSDLPPVRYESGSVSVDFMRELARLSTLDDGPRQAHAFLRNHGIALVIEPHLPRTHLDGAAIMFDAEGRPIIGLSLRYDRLDNFWFCLMHELAHIALHFDGDVQFYDDLDLEEEDDPREKDADNLAREALIPDDDWQRSAASKLRSPEAAQSLARRLHISPAIVAGRMRYEFKAYRLLNNLVGYGEVRKWFPEVSWR